MEQKYRRVAPAKARSPDDEIRVSGSGRITNYVTYAARLFNDQGKKLVTVRATGRAVASAVSVCEVIKRRFHGLHQVTEIGVTQIMDEFEPTEEGLDTVKHERTVPFIAIKLTTDEALIDKNHPGYQPPLPAELVSEFDPEKVAPRAPRSVRAVSTRGDYRPPARNGRRQRGDRSGTDDGYGAPSGYSRGRGRFSTRGGGYGGNDYQSSNVRGSYRGYGGRGGYARGRGGPDGARSRAAYTQA